METLLLQTLDPRLTKQSTAMIQQFFKQNENALAELFDLSTNTATPDAVRLAGMIYLKNTIKKYWRIPKDDEYKLPLGPDEEAPLSISGGVRSHIRSRIVDAAVSSPPKLREYLAISFESICREDFPEQWPTLLNELMRHVTDTSNFSSMDSGLALTLAMMKCFEFKTMYDDNRAAVRENVVAMILPSLLQMASSLLGHEGAEPWTLIHRITKIVASALTTGRMIDHIFSPDVSVFTAWSQLFARIVTHPVPEAFLRTGEEDERGGESMTVYWKPKKWVMRVIESVQQRYGTLDALQGVHVSERQMEAAGKFSVLYQQHFMPEFVKLVVQQVSAIRTAPYMPPRYVNRLLTYIDVCLEDPSARKLLKPLVQSLMFDVLPHLLALSHEDIKLFQNDPLEYIHRFFDEEEEFYSAGAAARNVWLHVVKHYAAMRNMAVGFCVNIIKSDPAGARDLRLPEAAYTALGAMDQYFSTKNMVAAADIIENFALQACAQAPQVLRARICWFLGECNSLEFQNLEGTSARIAETLLSCLLPPNSLVVRVMASTALANIVRNNEGLLVEHLRPRIQAVFESLFLLMDEVDQDEVINTLEALAGLFEDEIAPYAFGLAQRLVERFSKICPLLLEEDGSPEAQRAAMAAQAILGSLCTILKSVTRAPAIFAQLETLVLPLIHYLLRIELQDYFECTMDLLCYFSFFTPTFSPALFALYGPVLAAFEPWGNQYLEEYIAPLDNLITRATSDFLSNQQYMDMTFTVAMTAVEDEDDIDNTMHACLIFEAIAQNCRGRCDNFIAAFLTALTSKHFIETSRKTGAQRVTRHYSLRLQCVQAWCSAFFYSPSFAVSLISANPSWAGLLFPTWASSIPKFKLYHVKKVCALGLTGLLSLGPALPPALLQNAGLKSVLVSAFTLVDALVPMRRRREKLKRRVLGEARDDDSETEDEDDDGEDDDDDEEAYENFDIDENPEAEAEELAADAAYIKKLQREVQRQLSAGPGAGDDEDSDAEEEEEDEDDEDDEEDESYADLVSESAIDIVDDRQALVDVMIALQQNHPDFYNACILNSGLSEEEKALIQRVMQGQSEQK